MQPPRGLKKEKKDTRIYGATFFSKPELNDESCIVAIFITRVRRRVDIDARRINLGNGQCQYRSRSFTRRIFQTYAIWKLWKIQ